MDKSLVWTDIVETLQWHFSRQRRFEMGSLTVLTLALLTAALGGASGCTSSDGEGNDDPNSESSDDDDQQDDDDDVTSNGDDDDDNTATTGDDDDDGSDDDDDGSGETDDDDATEDSSRDPSDDDDDETDDDDDDETGSDTDSSDGLGIFVTPNLDDDNGDGSVDFDDGYVAQDNDITDYTLDELIDGHEYNVAVSGQLEWLKIWVNGQGWMSDNGGVQASFTFTAGADPLTLQVTMGDYNAKAKLTFTDASALRRGLLADPIEVPIHASPLILNHHLQPSESVHIIDVGSNSSMIAGYEAGLGAAFSAFNGEPYGNDVWLQDEVEFATLTGMNGARINVVMNSIRDRGLDPIAQDEWAGPNGRKADWVMGIWGSGTAQWGDHFGNLEASPPVTVDGVFYPFGRIYFGNRGHGKLNDELAGFLEAQEVQKPFTIDTSWLCIGHVDEFITFIPDSSSAKGFKLVFADTRAAYKWLESFDPDIELDLYAQAHGVATVGELASDATLKSVNETLQTDTLDPILAQLKKELALSDDDIILFPAIFEEGACGGDGQMGALIPGTINMIVTWKNNKTAQLFMADPFLRPSTSPQDDDPFIKATRELFPADLETHFLDDWHDYHLGHGEVHCGTNMIRTPIESWWKSALHLLPGTAR